MSTDSATIAHGLPAGAARKGSASYGSVTAVGLPALTVGSIALGLTLAGWVSATDAAAPVAIIAATAGVVLTVVWAAGIIESPASSVLPVLSGFWLSYGLLLVGLTDAWFAISVEAALRTQGIFLLSWLAIVVALTTLGALQSQLWLSAPLFRMDLAVVPVVVGTVCGSAGWLNLGGLLMFLFATVGICLDLAQSGGSPRAATQ